MRAVSLQPFSVGTQVLTITSPYLVHTLLTGMLSPQVMSKLRQDVQYGVLLDQLDANLQQGITKGRVTHVSSPTYKNRIDACQLIDLAVEIDPNETSVHDTQSVLRSTLQRRLPNGGTVEAFVNRKMSDCHIASLYAGADALVRRRQWAVFIDVDSLIVPNLQQYDDPGALSLIDEEVFLDECEHLSIDETDPAIQAALGANNQQAFIKRLLEVWFELPRFQPIALVLEDTPTNRVFAEIAYQTVVHTIPQEGQNLQEDAEF